MEIILKQDVENVGHKNEIVTVKDGYANNYLIPRGMAIMATPSAKKMYEEIARQRAHKEEKEKEKAEELAKQLEGLNLVIGAKTSSKGKIFGSINTLQIAEELRNQGIEVDRKNIEIKDEPIKEVGTYTATIKLHREVSRDITFEVKGE
ncbi:MAG: 50S ribosomal protein L9 [Bacteroidales bacterium]|nr:50S ribosomal protein L9 [Bacteroidales bacterium]